MTTGALLEDLRVLDLATGPFGYTGKLLAGFGADVIKVEPPSGDPVRARPPFVNDEPGPDRSLRHLHLNSGKRSCTVDIDRPEGQALLRRMVREADVLIESYAPGQLAARGLSYDDLIEERPDLVMASITFFGQDGPYAERPGSEILAQALGGYLHLNGDPDREPVKPYDDLVSMHAALHAATAVVTGIVHRDATGEGDHFDVAVYEAAMFLLGTPLQFFALDGRVLKRNGVRLLNREAQLPYPSTTRPCKDGWVHVHHSYSHPDLLAVLMEDPALNELMDAGPRGNSDAMDEHMDRWLANHDKFDAVRRAQELRLPFTEVLTPAEVLDDPQLAERSYFADIEHPGLGPTLQLGPAVRLSETPWRSARAPLLGEHSDEVLTELLGLSAAERAALRASGTIA